MRGVEMVTALILFAIASPSLAKDVAREQSAVQYARQEYEKAEAASKADAAQAAATRKVLEPLKKQLEEEQKRASLSEKKKQEAKARLGEAEADLDRAWKQ